MEHPDTRPIAVSIRALSKHYASGQHALKQVDLEIRRGEIFALLGPNGAGKTTLISIVCGIVTPSSGSVAVDGLDVARDWRAARAHWPGAAGVDDRRLRKRLERHPVQPRPVRQTT